MTTTNEVIRKKLQDLMFNSYPRLQNRMTPVPEIVTYTRLRELATCGWYALEDYWEAEYQEMIVPEPSFGAICGEVADHLHKIVDLLDEWKSTRGEEPHHSHESCQQADGGGHERQTRELAAPIRADMTRQLLAFICYKIGEESEGVCHSDGLWKGWERIPDYIHEFDQSEHGGRPKEAIKYLLCTACDQLIDRWEFQPYGEREVAKWQDQASEKILDTVGEKADSFASTKAEGGEAERKAPCQE